MRTRSRALTVLSLTLIVLACSFIASAPACCPAPPRGKPVVNADQTVILIWNPETKTEHFIRKASFKGEADDFGFLIPTPTQPQLEESGNEAFPFLLKLTEPETKRVPRPANVSCGCGAPEQHVTGGAKSVEVRLEKEVAGFNAAVLETKSASALTKWLRENGYAFSPEVEAWSKPYVDSGWMITALKVAKDKDGKNKKDGGIAPDLSWEGLIRDADWAFEHFKNPRSRMPDSIMPSFRYTDETFHLMTEYLMGLKTPAKFAPGEETFKAICARCHGEKGDGLGVTAVYVDPAPRDLSKQSFLATKSRQRLLDSIHNGVAGTSMPGWGKVLTDAQIEGTLNYVFTSIVKTKGDQYKDHKMPQTNPVTDTPDSRSRGEQTFLARCTGCHGRKADGKGPNSIDILPRPRNLRNGYFVRALPDKRMMDSILYGVRGTAMPSWIEYGLSQKDAGDLMNYVRSLTPATRPQAPIRTARR